MSLSLSALERKILEIVHADNRRGRRSTLATIEIALDEVDAKRVGTKAVTAACWEMEKLGLLATVKPAVTISAAGSATIGKPVETPEAEPVPELEVPAPVPVQAKAPPPTRLAFPPHKGETGLQVARRLLQSKPEGITTAQANEWTGMKLGSRFSELVTTGDAVGTTTRPVVYRLASLVADDARPDVAPVTDASPTTGPATAEGGDTSAVVEVAPVADAAPPMVVEMVEAVADAIASESPARWLARALSRIVGDGYHVEVDESEPCGVIIGTPGPDEIINVEICPVPGAADRHILWISPQGGMGVSFDDALLAAIRATCALTAPDEAPSKDARIANLEQALAETIGHLADALGFKGRPEDRTWGTLLDRVRSLSQAVAEAHGELLSALNCASPGRYDLLADTWEDALEEVRRIAGWRERNDEIITASAKTIIELRKSLADAKDGGEPHQLLANALGMSQDRPTSDLIEMVRSHIKTVDAADKAVDEAIEMCERAFANDLADALGVNVEDTDPSRAVATLLDEVRRRKPVAQILAEAEAAVVLRAQEDRNHIHAARRLLGVA